MRTLWQPEVLRGFPLRIARRAIAATLFAFLLASASAQNSDRGPVPSSDLARRNLNLVGASANQIELVLRKDAGLLVELKTWIARQAADHGQVLTDADLADNAVFDRLRVDTSLRAFATKLLQRYGYLLPTLNPDSRMARQQDLLMQERTKFLATQQLVPPPSAPNVSTAAKKEKCDPEQDADCEGSEQLPASMEEEPSNRAPSVNVPSESAPESAPSSPGLLLTRPLLERTSAGGADGAQLPGGASAMLGGGGAESMGALQGMSEQDKASLMAQYMSGGLGGGGAIAPEPPPDTRPQPVAASENTSADREKEHPIGTLPGKKSRPDQMVKMRNPYSDIPSLYDMYMQASDHAEEPTRFGLAVFQRGTRASRQIPMDLPAGPDYVVGPGDGLTVNLWGVVSQRLVRTVDRQGRLALPEAGLVMVSGKTLGDVQETVQSILRTQYKGVSVDVSLSRLRTVRVYVVGDVERPGAYDISALSTPLNALFVAGGPTAGGSLRAVRHMHGNNLVEVVDVYDLILKGVRSGIQHVDNGDTILVPPIGPQVTVEGAVRRPAIYELGGEKTLSQVLDLAGGMLPTATLRHIEVQRLVEHESRTMLNLDVAEGPSQPSVEQQLAAFQIQPGDVIHIFPIAPFNQDAVYLQGHVLRPGKYSFHKEMRVSDLVSSYSDLLPEAAQAYAEIIRLSPPAYAPSVFSFSLAAALQHPEASPLLQPLDTVRIFGRYDFENAPSVTVTGAVRHPGTYRTAAEVHVSDAIHLAGNLARDAMADDAQVFHHQADGQLQVLSVNLKDAESGNPVSNILLAPDDRLVVHEDLSKSDPATVVIQGEVANPGRYPLGAEFRAGDLIRVAGGLTRRADTNQADLTHYLTDARQVHGAVENVSLASALAGDPEKDPTLRNGDVLTVRQMPGWQDVGASISVEGEVQHPGTYGLLPGERLSSILKRAGGFSPEAYPYGAIFERVETRELEENNRADLIRRVQMQEGQLKLIPETDPEVKQAKDAALAQLRTTLQTLTTNASLGRVVIQISSKIDRWQNTPADIRLRAGDKIIIPKHPSAVNVLGQVYNPTSVTFQPGRNANWYLHQAGGTTALANKKGVFVIRADGSVLGGGHGFSGTALLPGDTVIVPERAYAGGHNWQNTLMLAQIISAVTTTAYFASLGL
jgi:polysaccharide biosynthesis/export protein